MVRRSLGDQTGLLVHPLSYVRQQRNWTHQDLVNAIAKRLKTAARREKAWRWEHWGVVPDDDTQLALAAELGVEEELVQSLGWPHWLPAGEKIELDAPWSFDATMSVLDRTAGSAMLDRRGFMVLGVGVAASLADQWLNIEPQALASVLRGGRIDANLVGCFEQRLPALRQMDATLGGGSVRHLVDAELRLVTDLLASGSYAAAIGTRLLLVAAELGRIAGWASFDAGYHAAAERYWVGALRAAHVANDRAAGANILKCMSLQRVDLERMDEALALSRTALEGAKNAPPRVVAMLTVRQARIHAVRGEATECERLLVKAERDMSHADDQPAPSWAAYFDHAEYCAQVAACYLQLRRHHHTDRWLDQSLALQPEERSRDRATYLIWRSDTAINLGELELACSLATKAIPDIASARSKRNQRRLQDLHAKLTVHVHPSVLEFNDKVRDLVA